MWGVDTSGVMGIRRAGWSQRRAVVIAVLLAVAGVSASVALGVDVGASQRAGTQMVMERRTDLAAGAVRAETGRYIDTLSAAAGAVGAFEDLTAGEFAQVAAPLARMNLAGATSLVYLVASDDAGVAATQRLWRSRGASGLRLAPQPAVTEHMFTIFSRPVDGEAPARVGIDVAQSPAPLHALAEARRSGEVAVSDAYHLIRDQNLPAGQRQLSFVLTTAVYGPADTAGSRPFRGWLLLGLRGHDFVTAAMSRVTQNLIDGSLSATAADGVLTQVAAVHAPVSGSRNLHRQLDVPVAQRRWRLQVDAAATALPGADHGTAVLITGGLVLTALLSVLVFTLATDRARAQARVEAATAELRASEQALRRQQADLTAFAGVVAHDLKAPLAAVLGHAEIIADALDAGDDPATVRPMLERVLAGGVRMSTLIDDLLAYATSRDSSLRPLDLNLRDLVDEVVIGYLDIAGATGAPMPAVFVGDLPGVHGDVVMLRQLLHNLVGNAIKYTAAGQTPRVDVTATSRAGQVVLQIADRGLGIPAGQHQAVFDSFHRAHTGTTIPGTGLGLAICQRITERHGGTITAEDNLGGGTRITVTLPAATAPASGPMSRSASGLAVSVG